MAESIGMSISGIVDRVWRLTPLQRMLITAFAAAAIADVSDPFRGVTALVIRACMWFTVAALIERTLESVRGAARDHHAFIAYLPLACATSALLLAEETAASVTRSGSLDNFFEAAISLLGLLLISLVVEARRGAAHDPWLRALRGWWVAFVVIGILYSLLGLLPDDSRSSREEAYAIAWTGLVGAVAALAVVMWRDPARKPGAVPPGVEIAQRQRPTSADELTGAVRTSTRTPVRSIRASHRAGRR
jgi:hypothetical protein